MLSALAKYIFGGVMGDAPETTPMQYETREINDWLLVDTPDQAIDDEDMDSESDEDEILRAVPLLMDEEESVIPRQIVLSYEANDICDNTCGKIRKDFHKLCPASKGQVHHGDKIQGNSVNNVEAISLKTGNGKLQDKLNEIQISSKSKKSRSRKNKPKNSKRSRVQIKVTAKCSDSSSTVKETNTDQFIQENSKDKNLNENVMKLELVDGNKIEPATEVQDNSLAISKSSSDKILSSSETFQVNDNMEDSDDFAWGNIFNDENTQYNSHNKNLNEKSKIAEPGDQNKIESVTEDNSFAISKRSSDISKKIKSRDLNKTELAIDGNDNSLPLAKKSSDKIQSSSKSFHKNSFSDILEDSEDFAWKNLFISHSQSSSNQEKINGNIKKSSTDHTESIFKNYEEEFPEIDSGALELFEEVCKKYNFQAEKEYDSKICIPPSNIKQNAPEFKVNSNKPKKYRFKKSKKCGFQDKFGKISSPISESQNKDFDNCVETKNKLQSVPFETVDYNIQNKLNNETVNISDQNSSNKLQDILATELQDDPMQDILEDVGSEYHTNAPAERLVAIKEDSQNKDIFGAQFQNIDTNTQKDSNKQRYETILESNVDEMKFISSDLQTSSVSKDINRINFVQNSKAVYESKNSLADTIQDALKVKDNSTDNILDSFANFWDIYTKIQDVSDDELQEMLDNDMNENSHKLQESLFRAVNELEVTEDDMGEFSDDEEYEKPFHNVMGLWYSKTTNPCNSAFRLSPHEKSEEEPRSGFCTDNQKFLFTSPAKACTIDMGTSFIDLAKDCYDLFEDLNQNETQISNHNTACVPYTEYELAEYFNSEPRRFYAYQTLHYPSSYALAIAEFYAKREHYYQECHSYPCFSECCDICAQNYKDRFEEDSSSPSPIKARIITNSAELLQNLISQKSTILPKKTAVVLEHVKELKSVQQAIQFDARRYLSRSQLNKQNRNYIYQCSAKSNRRKNLQRNHSGANNNRKCCY